MLETSLQQQRVLTTVAKVDQRQACSLLGLSGDGCFALLDEKKARRELLRFTLDGKPVYPRFQFDAFSQRVYPAMRRIITAKPSSWSDYRFLHWMTTQTDWCATAALLRAGKGLSLNNLNLGQLPADEVASNADAVLWAFEEEIPSALARTCQRSILKARDSARPDQ